MGCTICIYCDFFSASACTVLPKWKLILLYNVLTTKSTTGCNQGRKLCILFKPVGLAAPESLAWEAAGVGAVCCDLYRCVNKPH